MRVQFLMLLILAALLQACALQEERAYAISRATPRDGAKVRQILRDVARQVGLPPSMRQLDAHGAWVDLASHQSTNVWLRANIGGDHIEVFLNRTDWPPPRAFTKADELLVSALSAAFGQRFGAWKPDPNSIESVVVY